MENRLLLGSGIWHWNGWTTLDANAANDPDVLAIVPPLPEAITSKTWREIVCSHMIEHVYLDEAKALLKECYAILEVGGVLTLEQPNLEYCMRVALGDIDPPPGRDRVQFGLQGIFGLNWTGNHWDGHHFGYTPNSLTELLLEAGFERDKIVVGPGVYHEKDRDFQLIATK